MTERFKYYLERYEAARKDPRTTYNSVWNETTDVMNDTGISFSEREKLKELLADFYREKISENEGLELEGRILSDQFVLQ